MKVAVHEAGHAVAHVRLGIDQLCVSIVANEEMGTGGHTTSACEPWDEEEAHSQVLAYCAGYAALVASGSNPDEAAEGCDGDFDAAVALLEFWSPGDSLEKCKTEAVSMMSKAENRRAVAIVADYLETHLTVDADVIAVLVELADGQISAEEFERYLFMSSQARRKPE